MGKSEGEAWLAGRNRHVRVYLTDEEHAMVRAAAARADLSVSRFSIEAIVEAAQKGVEQSAPPPPAPEPKPAKGRKKK